VSDALKHLLAAAERTRRPVFSYDLIDRWLGSAIDRCVATGLLRPSVPAKFVTCRECGEEEEVIFLENELTKQLEPFTACPEAGPNRIELDELKRWEMSFSQLLDAVFAGVVLSGDRQEVVRERVWRLGKATWGGAARNVYFARGLHRRDAWQVLNEARLTTRSVIFVPVHTPEPDSHIEVLPAVIPLSMAISWEGTTIHFDHDYVEAELKDALATQGDGNKPQLMKRSPRAALIAELTREMQEHLRAARDHAVDTMDQTGTPQLLPRPQKDFLAKKVGVNKSTVTRAFSDDEARELCFLWELADDLDRILARGA